MWKIFSISYRDGRLIEMWKEKKIIEFFPTIAQVWKRSSISYKGWRIIEMWKEKKSMELEFVSNYTEIFHKLKCGR
jgi:hypothetical protein